MRRVAVVIGVAMLLGGAYGMAHAESERAFGGWVALGVVGGVSAGLVASRRQTA